MSAPPTDRNHYNFSNENYLQYMNIGTRHSGTWLCMNGANVVRSSRTEYTEPVQNRTDRRAAGCRAGMH